MFEAIRSRLVGAWKDLRTRGLPSLFVFELVVVTLGVLLAQSIAEFSDERAAVKRMRAAEIQWFETGGSAASGTEIWMKSIPCLRDRLSEFRLTLASGALRPEDVQRPGIIAPLTPSLNEEAALLLGEAKGHDLVERMRIYSRSIETLEVAVWNFANGWGKLSVAASGAGPVTAGDRQEARNVLAELEAQLGSIQRMIEFAIPYGSDLGIEPTLPNGRPMEGCADMWRYNSMIPPEDSPVIREESA